MSEDDEMRHIPTTRTATEKLRREAKRLAKTHNIPHAAALDQVSRVAGYDHWKHVLLCGRKTAENLVAATPSTSRDKRIAAALLVAFRGLTIDPDARPGERFFVEFAIMVMLRLLEAMLEAGEPITEDTVIQHLRDQGQALSKRDMRSTTRENLQTLAEHPPAHFNKMMASFYPFLAQQIRMFEAELATEERRAGADAQQTGRAVPAATFPSSGQRARPKLPHA